MKRRIRNWVKERWGLYDLDELQTWAHCGCCGAFMPEEIVPKYWAWSLCRSCINA